MLHNRTMFETSGYGVHAKTGRKTYDDHTIGICSKLSKLYLRNELNVDDGYGLTNFDYFCL